MKKLKQYLAIAATLALLAPAAAVAQSSQEAYGGDNSAVAALDEGNGGGGGGGSASADSSLPFTGGDLGALAGAGGLMLALGFGLRRLTNRPAG